MFFVRKQFFSDIKCFQNIFSVHVRDRNFPQNNTIAPPPPTLQVKWTVPIAKNDRTYRSCLIFALYQFITSFICFIVGSSCRATTRTKVVGYSFSALGNLFHFRKPDVYMQWILHRASTYSSSPCKILERLQSCF